MSSPEAAKAALRSTQNSVLGRGKRARGVTVTRSNQEELMRAVSWNFFTTHLRDTDNIALDCVGMVLHSSSLRGKATLMALGLLYLV